MRIEYTTACPECTKMGHKATLGFESDTALITCTGENAHVFDSLPGDPAPYSGPENQSKDTPSTGKFTQEPSGSEREWTREEEAALDEQMKTAPRRDFGTQVADDESLVSDVPYPMPDDTQIDGSTLEITGIKVPESALPPAIPESSLCTAVAGHMVPVVALGGFTPLAGGDVLVGVRISETWVSAMQAEGENQTPQRNVAEYLQEIIDQGLLEWHTSGPVAK